MIIHPTSAERNPMPRVTSPASRKLPKALNDELIGLGFSDPRTVAMAASFLWQYQNLGHLDSTTQFQPTDDQLLFTIHRNRGLERSCQLASRDHTPKTANLGMLPFCHYVFSCEDEAEADRLMDDLVTGERDYYRQDPLASGIVPGLPAFALLGRLRGGRSRSPRPQPANEASSVFCAWNHFVRGSEVFNLKPDNRPLKDYL